MSRPIFAHFSNEKDARKIFDRDLIIQPPSSNRMALVLQDDRHNTYEGCDSGANC